jgi:fatty-acyl-CoA synthase
MIFPAGNTFELDWLKRWAQVAPNREALRCTDSQRSFSYREFFERSSSLAVKLRTEYSVKKGDRVAILAWNEPETFFLFFALQRLGAILVPVNYRYTAREVEHVLRDSGAKLFFFQNEFATLVADLEQAPDHVVPFATLQEQLFSGAYGAQEFSGQATDPVMILYTSGTTGAPKGAIIHHEMLFWNSVNTGLRLEITSKDKTLIFHPLFHTSGWNVLSTPFFHHGACIVLKKKFEPEEILQLCQQERLTILFGVPTMMDRMARAANFSSADLSSVRYAIVGGEPMPVPLITAWAEKSVPVRQGFGLTEFGPNVFSLNEEDAVRKMGSIGFPNFYVNVRVVDAQGAEVRVGEVGELLLNGPMCTPGYWQNSSATAEAIQEGWFHTGDLVKFDEEGYFYVVGRKKEMFISGAENVYPAEVEKYLREHPALKEVAVIGVKDSQWGEVGKCYYATESGEPLEENELKSFCQRGLAKYKIPKHFEHLSELPKGDSGKILKKALISRNS